MYRQEDWGKSIHSPPFSFVLSLQNYNNCLCAFYVRKSSCRFGRLTYVIYAPMSQLSMIDEKRAVCEVLIDHFCRWDTSGVEQTCLSQGGLRGLIMSLWRYSSHLCAATCEEHLIFIWWWAAMHHTCGPLVFFMFTCNKQVGSTNNSKDRHPEW